MTTKRSLEELQGELPLGDDRLAKLIAMPDEDINTDDIPELDEDASLVLRSAQVRLVSARNRHSRRQASVFSFDQLNNPD